MRDADIAIVGGGMVGLALARALADSRLSVLLLERDAGSGDQAPSPGSLPYAARVSALTATSLDWLGQLAGREGVEGLGQSYRRMEVWDAEGNGSVHYDAAEIHEPRLGMIAENHRIQALLRAAGETQDNLILRQGCVLEALDSTREEVRLTLGNGEQPRVRLVVGADGGQSTVRALSGLSVRTRDYGQRAIVTTVATEKPHRETAWQRFMTTGPLAFLPLPDSADGQHCCSIVWSCTEARHDALMALEDEAFARQLGEAFEHRLGRVLAVNPRQSYPLREQHAPQYVARGVALVGDAAHVIHPLAGQGVNLGLSDARALSSVISNAQRTGLDIAHPQVLAAYQRQRKGENLAMMMAMDGFRRLFGRDDLLLRWLRNTGLRLVDRQAALKRLIMQQAG